jgi:outer membrane protein assembly factor BamB
MNTEGKMDYDHHVNGWNIYVCGYGWGYSVAAIHQNTGRKVANFPTMNDAIQYCLDHDR